MSDPFCKSDCLHVFLTAGGQLACGAFYCIFSKSQLPVHHPKPQRQKRRGADCRGLSNIGSYKEFSAKVKLSISISLAVIRSIRLFSMAFFISFSKNCGSISTAVICAPVFFARVERKLMARPKTIVAGVQQKVISITDNFFR